MEPTPTPPDETGPPAPSLIQSLEGLWEDLRGSAHDHLQLAALEAQRAVLSLVWVAIYGTIVGMLVAATWLVVTGALVLWLIEAGLVASIALLIGAAVNLLGATGFAILMRRKSGVLLFPATLRSLDPDNSGPDTPGPEPLSSPPTRKP